MNFVNSDFNIPISDRLYESLLHSNYPKISLFIESVKFCKFYSLEKTKMDDPYTHIPYIKRYVNLFDYGAIPYTAKNQNRKLQLIYQEAIMLMWRNIFDVLIFRYSHSTFALFFLSLLSCSTYSIFRLC